jgi:hypothetical protein
MTAIFYRTVLATLVLGSLGFAARAQEQPGPRPAAVKTLKLFEFGRGPAASGVSNVLEVLRDKKAQDEIGLLPVQAKQLKSLSEQLAVELAPLMQEFQTLPKAEKASRMDDFRREIANRLQGVDQDLNRILVPEQQERLKQVAFQRRLRQNGWVQTLTSPDVLQTLHIGDSQAERIRDNLAKVEDKYRQKRLDLQAENEREILAQFSPQQQDQLKAMMGPKVALPINESGDRSKGSPTGRR